MGFGCLGSLGVGCHVGDVYVFVDGLARLLRAVVQGSEVGGVRKEVDRSVGEIQSCIL